MRCGLLGLHCRQFTLDGLEALAHAGELQLQVIGLSKLIQQLFFTLLAVRDLKLGQIFALHQEALIGKIVGGKSVHPPCKRG